MQVVNSNKELEAKVIKLQQELADLKECFKVLVRVFELEATCQAK